MKSAIGAVIICEDSSIVTQDMTDHPENHGADHGTTMPDDRVGEGGGQTRRRLHYAAVLTGLALLLIAGAMTLHGSRRKGCENAPCPGLHIPLSSAPFAQLPGRQVEPTEKAVSIVDVEDARALNGAVPFLRGPMASARPFRFSGAEEDRQRGVTCLAAAQLYEAGLSEKDQKAVAQVILNRVRHPAYPHSICAVVFEGAERSTGCQFTFTCDGALARRYPESAWEAARKLASRMIDGEVDSRVGWATHYHTDWVYPYWSPSLDKLSAIGTHLFFKWRGYWGTGPAFSAPYAGKEAAVKYLAATGQMPMPTEEVTLPQVEQTSDLQTLVKPLADAPLPAGVSAEALSGNALKLAHPDGGSYGLLIRHGASGDELLSAALRLCFGENFCRVMAWDSLGNIPRGFPVPPPSLAALRFSYVRDPQAPRAQAHFDCTLFPRTKKEQCL